jgi:hypothetical protein
MILGATDQKLWMFENLGEVWAAKKNLFLTFLGWVFFHKFSTKFLIISST